MIRERINPSPKYENTNCPNEFTTDYKRLLLHNILNIICCFFFDLTINKYSTMKLLSLLSLSLTLLSTTTTNALSTNNDDQSIQNPLHVLAPHEIKFYESLNKIHLDHAMELKSLHADNATVELACGKDQVRRGSFEDVFDEMWQPKVAFAKTKIEPITTTNDEFPEKGIFSFHWMTFIRTKDDCSAIFSGFALVKVSSFSI